MTDNVCHAVFWFRHRACVDYCNAFPQKSDSVIGVKVEFGEDEGRVPLTNIAKGDAAYKSKGELPAR